MICNISYADFSCNILYTCVKHIEILSKSYATCVRIISKYMFENTHFGGNLFGPLSNSQRYHFVADQATKPLLQRFAPWEAESIQEIAEEFQYLWLHWMCRNDGMCFYVQTYIYTLEHKWPGYVDWILYLVSEGEKVSKIKKHSQVRDIFTRFLVPRFSSAFLWKAPGESPGWWFAGFLGVFHIWKRENNPNSWSLSISC